MKFPFEIVNGGAAWNMPEKPTLAEAAAAAGAAMHLVITTAKGTCFMNRDLGTEADSLLFETISEAAADQLKREVAVALSTDVSYVSITSISAALAEAAIVLEIRYRLKYSNRDHVMQTVLPMRG